MPPKAVRVYEAGDLVFARLKGYPPWPARVEENLPAGYKPTPGRYPVFFFGTYETAVVASKDISPYEQYKHQYGIKRKMKNFNEGLDEIENNPNLSMDTDDLLKIREERAQSINAADSDCASDSSFQKSDVDNSSDISSNESDSLSDDDKKKKKNGKFIGNKNRSNRKNKSKTSDNSDSESDSSEPKAKKIKKSKVQTKKPSKNGSNRKSKGKFSTKTFLNDSDDDEPKNNKSKLKKQDSDSEVSKSSLDEQQQSDNDNDEVNRSMKRKSRKGNLSNSDDDDNSTKLSKSNKSDNDSSDESEEKSKKPKKRIRVALNDSDSDSSKSKDAKKSKNDNFDDVIKLKQRLALKLEEKEREKERRKREKMEQKRLERTKKAQADTNPPTVGETLASIDQNIKMSLKINNANVSKCLAAMTSINDVKITAQGISTYSQQLKELIQTLKKCKKYKADLGVMQKADECLKNLQSKFKENHISENIDSKCDSASIVPKSEEECAIESTPNEPCPSTDSQPNEGNSKSSSMDAKSDINEEIGSPSKSEDSKDLDSSN